MQLLRLVVRLSGFLGERDDFFREGAESLGFRKGGLNAVVNEERGGEVRQESDAVLFLDAELMAVFAVTHDVLNILSKD